VNRHAPDARRIGDAREQMLTEIEAQAGPPKS